MTAILLKTKIIFFYYYKINNFRYRLKRILISFGQNNKQITSKGIYLWQIFFPNIVIFPSESNKINKSIKQDWLQFYIKIKNNIFFSVR